MSERKLSRISLADTRFFISRPAPPPSGPRPPTLPEAITLHDQRGIGEAVAPEPGGNRAQQGGYLGEDARQRAGGIARRCPLPIKLCQAFLRRVSWPGRSP